MSAVLAVLLSILAATPPDPPVEQTKKNIKVLQGLPSSQLIPVMAFMSNSLGVTCAHCHAKEFASDEKPAKTTARTMIAMQRAINEQQFAGKLTVTCNTCHRGSVKPVATPDVADAGWSSHPPASAPESAAAEAVARLPEPMAGVTARRIRGTVERFNGRDEPKSEPFTLVIEGDTVKYETALSHPPEAPRALAVYLLPRPAIRLYRETPTPLGNLPEAIDYGDFRDTDTGRLPFRAQWSRADYRVTYTIEEVQ